MSGFQLSPNAFRDLEEIRRNRTKYLGEQAGDEIEASMLAACERICQVPGIGHRRPDLTQRPYFFYGVDPYLIVYAREMDPLPIIAILHASRNVQKMLRTRSRIDKR